MERKLQEIITQDPPEGKLWIIPLGGLGEIGKNMLVLHYDREIIVIDAGLMFPVEEMYGVDIVIPDITYLLNNKEKIKAIILTHGHEDHIGAVPYILPQLNVPVYGTELTLGILKAKLREYHLEDNSFNEIQPGENITFKNFKIETFRVIHSISEGIGLAIHTPIGTIVHSGDFKFDLTPVDGKKPDFEKLSQLGEKGVLLLLSDSTYAERPGHSSSEAVVGRTLEQIFSNPPGRIIITTFASSVPRIQQIINISNKFKRKLCVLGKSLVNVVNIATELGYLHLPPGLTIPANKVSDVSDKDLVILTTGSQGEPLSALTLMATRNHKWVTIKKGDTVILSATPVPGNETLVNKIIDLLFKLGADVTYSIIPKSEGALEQGKLVHVSGHGSQEELKKLIGLLKPKYFVPIHGEYRHLVWHSRLANEMGIKPENVFVIEDGAVLEISSKSANILGKTDCGDVLVDGLGIGDVGKVVLRDRHLLSQDGICIIVASVNRTTGELLSGPEVISRGFVYFRISEKLIKEAKEKAKEIFLKAQEEGLYEMGALKITLKESVGKFFQKKIKRRPMIVPVIMEV